MITSRGAGSLIYQLAHPGRETGGAVRQRKAAFSPLTPHARQVLYSNWSFNRVNYCFLVLNFKEVVAGGSPAVPEVFAAGPVNLFSVSLCRCGGHPGARGASGGAFVLSSCVPPRGGSHRDGVPDPKLLI